MVIPAPAPFDQPGIIPRRPLAKVWKQLVGSYIPPIEEVEGKAAQHADNRVLIPEGPGCLKAAVLVLFPSPRCEDQGHAAGRALLLELEGKEVRDLGRAAVATSGQHIVPEQQIHESPQVALSSHTAMRPELVADAFEFLLCIPIEEGITALIGVASLILLCIPALEGLEVLPNVILPG
ncbi:hypothetical protein BGZ61DRAFT_485677 [Ilyonectria robusta]|uniref:uncharacterized protein n=1 Tax=Ilyonectria robusta TaxID=1079257 RepID=UPI001E8CC493|nr:uncharacterized protein BGZ61DRAFT_485677 [Ilyonectria robusta]KAH8659696.1 hypothetical protein BGZ61DRAFT_485677 [Ilyonectria robusta]